MSQSRLTTALTTGAIDLPSGPIAVLRPGLGYDLSALPQAQVQVAQSEWTAADFWTQAGYTVTRESEPAAVALVVLPRSKALGRGMVAQAATLAPFVVIDGQKTDGADSLWRDLRARLGEVPSLTKAHGRLMWCAPGDRLADWALGGPVAGPDGLYQQPGMFSETGVDPGSALLAAALPAKLPARMADLGAGGGYLSRAVLDRPGVVTLDLVEAEGLALDCARLNVTDSRAAFHWADATRFTAGKAWDGVVMNPPFHAGRDGEPALGRAFIAAAARGLTPQGSLWMVANRHLPYEAELAARFRDIRDLGGNGAFKLYHAARPKR
jgi:16S rRNA (guanine1207-N2)-methyltransferase